MMPLTPVTANDGGVGVGRGGDRVDNCFGEDTPWATTPAFKGSPSTDADGDESIRTTFRMVAPVALRTT